MAKLLTITNYNKKKKWGWGFSTSPTGNGTGIETPTHPSFEGTISQVLENERTDAIFNSLGSVIFNKAYFYQGERIVATWVLHQISGFNKKETTPGDFAGGWKPGLHFPYNETVIDIQVEGGE